MYKVTVFTPTFNRVHTLVRLYNSLLLQTNKNFEWVVVDDGSTDGTSEFFFELENHSHIEIKYFRVNNGGKHRAINYGLDRAEGEYFFIVDSDDYLTADCIERIIFWINSLASETEYMFSGVCGLKGYDNERMVGRTFDGSYIDCLPLDRHSHNIVGDKSEVYRTEILRQYRFPEIEGEKFLTEAVVWNRISYDGYLIRYYNEINYICEYREDGLTKNIDRLLCENFNGYSLYVKELLGFKKMKRMSTLRVIMAYGYRGRIKGYSYTLLSNNIKKSWLQVVILSSFGSIYMYLKKLLNRRKDVLS